MIKKVLFNKRGEGYIDVVVSVFVIMILLVLTLNVFSFLTIKQDMDYFAKELIDSACANGKISSEAFARRYELTTETGLFPIVNWQTTYFNSSARTVQLGNTITVILTYNTHLEGFGVFSIPITLTAKYSGLSKKYWK